MATDRPNSDVAPVRAPYVGRWWHREGDRVRCTLCPRRCVLADGQRGFCFVRQNQGGSLILTTYGRSTGFCIDPIEKKPLNHFLPGTPILSFGTAGCNLGCKFCQNWDISKSREVEILSDLALPTQIVQSALDNECRSIAFTYNDPVVWAEYAIDTAKEARKANLKTVAVTAGYITPEARREFFQHFDAANVDLKAFTESFYEGLTLSHLEPVLDTLKWLHRETDVWFEITNLLIPTQNDSEEELHRLCAWISEELSSDVPIHFSAFHPDYKLRDLPATPVSTLLRAREIALEHGLHYAYVGNCHGQEPQSTYCPTCKFCLIQRDWYQLGQFNLVDSRCPMCRSQIPGVFDNQPGSWGPKRQPVEIPSGEDAAVVQIRKSTAFALRTTAAYRTKMDHLSKDFSAEERSTLLQNIRGSILAAVTGSPPPSVPAELGAARIFGAFVTLKRGGLLRACRGRWGNDEGITIDELSREIAAETALSDPRFPRISASELDFITCEISILHSPKVVAATGTLRLNEVLAGKHGVVVIHPRGRGLLLPQVATENGWTSEELLRAVSEKAGLESNAWESATLLTFEASHFSDNCSRWEPSLYDLEPARLASVLSGTADHPSLIRRSEAEIGVQLNFTSGRSATAIQTGKSIAEITAALLNESAQSASTVASMTVLCCPIPLHPEDFPHRMQTYSPYAARARCGDRSALFTQGVQNPIAALMSALQEPTDSFSNGTTQVDTFRIRSVTLAQSRVESIRKPAVAGRFYPDQRSECLAELNRLLTPSAERRSFRALLLPHAGWKFCGHVLANTIAQARIPNRVIILSPKHTASGPPISIASHTRWETPLGTIQLCENIRSLFRTNVPAVPIEPDAHTDEHGVEVIVPFIQHLNPQAEILPIVLGSVGEEIALRFGALLAQLIPEETLLIASSDMNHFATDLENRRKDRLALDALLTGDARQLFTVCQQNDISMCGLLPAVAVITALRAKRAELTIDLTGYDTSAAVTGDYTRVVGYAGATFL